jgi:NodT family efflux transporter outer membrane factor (OMF) lipoprotein
MGGRLSDGESATKVRRRRFGAALTGAMGAALCLLSGCRPVGPDYRRPNYTAPDVYKEAGAPTVTVPPPPDPKGGSWHPATPSDGMLRGKWWETFNDPQLNQLEERIATYNQGLHAAYETYLAAREQVKSARASYYPTLSLTPDVNRDRVSLNRPLNFGDKTTNYSDFVLEGQASWEPDLWGKVRRTVEGYNAAAQASAADMANTNLSLQSQMAESYFLLRGLDLQKQLLQSAVDDLNNQYDLTKRRFAGGIGTAADVALAETQLETTRAQMVDVGIMRAQYEHMVGTIADIKLPGFSIAPDPLELDADKSVPPKVPLGIPSQLLERRPDIAAAERRAANANAQIGVAVAAFYPTITLGGTGGFESTDLTTLIQGPSSLWSLGAQAAQLLIDGGQRRAVTNQARDLFEASASNYKGVVFLAFNEVEDKLSNLRILEQEEGTERTAVGAAQRSLDLAKKRYTGGVTSYLEVLTAESALITDQRTLADIKSRQFAATVELMRALGGGWDVSQLPK